MPDAVHRPNGIGTGHSVVSHATPGQRPPGIVEYQIFGFSLLFLAGLP
jgi:hypothetical protein